MTILPGPLAGGGAPDRLSERLFAPVPRWGWELRLPDPPRPSPERPHPPVQPAPPPRYIPGDADPARQRRLWTAAAISVAVGVLVGIFAFTHTGMGSVAVNAIIGVPVAIYAFRSWYGATRDGPVRLKAFVGPSVAVGLAALIVPDLVLLVLAVMLFRATRQRMVPNPRWQQLAEQDQWNYTLAYEQWQRRVAEFEASDRRRYEQANVWYPVQPAPAMLTCVFGGAPASWELLLTTLGSSLLGSGQRVTIVHLSRRRPATELLKLVHSDVRRQIPVLQLSLPTDSQHPRLSQGLDYPALASLLVEVLHSQQQDADASRRERQEDRSVLREIASEPFPVTIWSAR
jgi:hypothetical protein